MLIYFWLVERNIDNEKDRKRWFFNSGHTTKYYLKKLASLGAPDEINVYITNIYLMLLMLWKI